MVKFITRLGILVALVSLAYHLAIGALDQQAYKTCKQLPKEIKKSQNCEAILNG